MMSLEDDDYGIDNSGDSSGMRAKYKLFMLRF